MIISLETRLLYYCWLGGFLEGSDNLRQQKMGTATTIRGSIDLDVSSTVSFEKMLTWVFLNRHLCPIVLYYTILQDVFYFGEIDRTCTFAVY